MRATTRWGGGLLLGALGVSAAAGCAQILGIVDTSEAPSTASGSTSSGGGGAGVGPTSTSTSTGSGGSCTLAPDGGDVKGTFTPVYLVDGGTDPVPTSLVGTTIAAYAGPDSCGNFEALTVPPPTMMTPTGTFTIKAVPQAPYYLFFNSQVYLLESRTPELGAYVLGRTGQVPVTANTTAILSAMGLKAWATGDEIQLISFSANTWVRGGSGFPLNATTFNNLKVNWYTDPWGGPGTILNPSDTLTLIQLVNHTGTVSYRTAEYAGSVMGINMVNGMNVMAPTAMMMQLPLTVHSVNWDIPDFELHQKEVDPTMMRATIIANEYHVAVLGAPTMYGLAGNNAPDLVVISGPTGADAGASVMLSLSYGNPFPGNPTFCEAVNLWTVNYSLPGSTTPYSIPYGMTNRDPMCGSGNGGAMKVTLSPPQSVVIDGSPFEGSTTTTPMLKSLTPTVSWSPPKVGTPSRYDLQVIPLKVVQGQTQLGAGSYALHTTQHNIRIPPTVLKPGSYYAFVLLASQNCGTTCDADPTRFSLPSAFAPTFGGIFNTPAM
jgi:hypothetical protein